MISLPLAKAFEDHAEHARRRWFKTFKGKWFSREVIEDDKREWLDIANRYKGIDTNSV